jgi:hypothetical protein
LNIADPAGRMEQLSYVMNTPGLPVSVTSRQFVEKLAGIVNEEILITVLK